jgi:hypothetical protein
MKTLFAWILVLHSLTAFGQRYDYIGNKLIPNSKVSYTKPLILFNRDSYTPGDSVFFRMFVLTEDTTYLLKSALYNIDLFNSGDELVLHELILAGPAGTFNQLVLPKNLSHGTYQLYVYSGKSLPTNTAVFPIEIAKNFEKKTDTLKIFTEGGHILNNCLSRVILKSISLRDSKVALYDEFDEVTTAFINSDGWGSLLFVPHAEKNYHILDRNEKKNPLPKVESTGLCLRLFQLNKNLKVVEVNSTISEPLTLMLLDQRKLVYKKNLDFSRGKSQVIFEDSFFPQGYSHLIVVNNRQEVIAQRPVYIKPKLNLKVDLDCPDIAGQRQSVKCKIKVTDTNNTPIQSALAISVFHKTDSSHAPQITDPSLSLSPFKIFDNASDPESITNELIAQSADLFKGKKELYEAVTPVSSVFIKGRLISSSPNLKTDTTILYFFFQKSLDRYQTQIGRDGTFEFSHALFEDDYLYYRIEKNGKELSNAKIVWENPFATKEIDSTDKEKTTIANRINDSYQHYSRVNGDIKNKFGLRTNKQIEEEFGGADIEINPDEYTAFETMEDLFREIVPNLLFRKNSKDSLFRVYLETKFSPHPIRFSDGNPLFVVDGWMTNNTSEIMRLNATSIAYIKLIKETGKLYGIGPAARNGVVIIQTKSPDQSFARFGQKLLKVKGIPSGQTHAYVPPKSKRHPSFETNLYWEPAAFTNTDGTYDFSFYSSDMIGEFVVRISGMARNGEFIQNEKSLHIRFGSIDK